VVVRLTEYRRLLVGVGVSVVFVVLMLVGTNHGITVLLLAAG
jgi:hypothetical protein